MKSVYKITGIYLTVALLWIFISDEVALWMFGDDVMNLKTAQTYKGILFVTITALMLFFLLRKHYKTLNGKISQLEDINKKLENSNKELEQFAYIASHDLQEPLRMVSSFLSQLENKYRDKLDQKAHQYIYFAVDGAHRMRQIIMDLLNYSRIGQFNNSKEPIAIEDVIRDFCNTHREAIEKKQAQFVFDKLPVINNYKTSVTQIFHNLLDNALKYSKEDTPAVIKIQADDKDTHWQFSITDNGIGISEKAFDEIFVIFRRLHDKDSYSGTGIGLAIVKKNIEKLKGTIWVDSKINLETTFSFTLKK
jgi:light-regulated signal transduction histidine kinase (bacteriophytochrome)